MNMNGTEFEDRERGFEADARDRLYIQNAFATLSSPREVMWYGAKAGFQAGACAVAAIAVLLVAIMVAAIPIDGNQQFATLYGPTPVVGTILEPLWPLLLALVLMPLYAVVGAVGGLLRRAENRRRRALHHYFEPVRPQWDRLMFLAVTCVLVLWGIRTLQLTSSEADVIGLAMIVAAVSCLFAWPIHLAWLAWYLPLIRSYGSASLVDIVADIHRQAGVVPTNPSARR